MQKTLQKLSVRLLLSFGIVAAIGYGLLLLIDAGLSGTSHVVTLSLDKQTSIRITQENFCDPACAYYYQVFLSKKPLTERHYLGASNDDPKFEIRLSEDKDLVVVIEKSAPDIVLMFYEFSTGNEYPGDGTLENGTIKGFYEGEEQGIWKRKLDHYYQMANTIITKIDSDLTLSDQVSGRTLKIY